MSSDRPECLDEQLLNEVGYLLDFSILELIRTENFSGDKRWIAERLAVDEGTIGRSLERLATANLVNVKGEKIELCVGQTRTEYNVPSQAVKNFHDQALKKAATALHFQSMKEREFQTYVIAVDKDHVQEAKQKIDAFVKSFNDDMELSSKKTEVYCLGVQFFKLTH